MKTTLTIITAVMLTAGVFAATAHAKEYHFGDHKSSTLTVKAWQALSAEEYEDALVYTRKCIELYQEAAGEMQAGLDDYVTGTEQEVHSYWALNDVATSLFIQAKSLIALDRTEEAAAVIQDLIDNYTYGQCWDPSGGWFWRPAEAARELL